MDTKLVRQFLLITANRSRGGGNSLCHHITCSTKCSLLLCCTSLQRWSVLCSTVGNQSCKQPEVGSKKNTYKSNPRSSSSSLKLSCTAQSHECIGFAVLLFLLFTETESCNSVCFLPTASQANTCSHSSCILPACLTAISRRHLALRLCIQAFG